MEKTNELKNVLNYMRDTLLLEAPAPVISIEYLIASILDNTACHAHFVIEECIMSDSVDELRSIYDEFLRNKSKNQNSNIKIENVPYSDEINDILHFAELEKERSNSKFVGTEHVLLSLLNRDSRVDEKTFKILQNVGLSYPLVLEKCVAVQTEVEKMTSQSKKKENEARLLNDIAKTFTNKDNNNQENISVSKPTTSTAQIVTHINKYTTNLTQLAREGKLPPLINRERELNQIVKTLARKRKNNVIMVGSSGCGKTQIGYGLANLIVSENVPMFLEGKEVLLLNMASLISGTHLRGMFEERVRNLFDELKKNKKYILFIDNMQYSLKSSTKESDSDLSSTLCDVLNEGDIRIIGAVTPKAYHNSIESNQAIASKMQKIVIEPMTSKESVDVLQEIKHDYEEYHNVFYPLNVIKSAVLLAERYITDRCLPDSAIDVIDLCGAQTVLMNKGLEEIDSTKKRLGEISLLKMKALADYDFMKLDSICEEEKKLRLELANQNKAYKKNKEDYNVSITEEDVAKVISDMCGIPTSNLSIDERKKIAHIDEILKQTVIGQDEAIETICKAIKRNKAGLNNPNRPLLVSLLVGQSGTGKTLIAKQLAKEIYGDEKALIRIDMSEYSEKNSVTKLTGSAPGYIGYDQGGQLTEAIKNKQYCVLLLDEIEKADESIYNIFLQLFDEGRLTDSTGTIVNFKNVIILMTSNVGAKRASELGGGIGFNSNAEDNKKGIINKELRKRFAPEFLNRIDKIVHFNPLSDENLKDIVKLECKKFAKRINDLNYEVKFSEEVYDYLHKEALKQKEYGARPIIRLIQDNIEDAITSLMLENEYDKGYVFNIELENGKIKII